MGVEGDWELVLWLDKRCHELVCDLKQCRHFWELIGSLIEPFALTGYGVLGLIISVYLLF